jgi:glycosyltransferase involved in cell wall biosynthesis
MSNPRISIVIPCYNHGIYIQDAIDSVEASSHRDYEIIIVNDGSTDPFTIEKMDQLSQCGYQVINQPNQGVIKARNNGIAPALGEYIMPLDADNKIRPTYIEKAIATLDNQPEIGVVYGKSVFFGEFEGGHYSGEPFDPVKLYWSPYIDNLAVFRKSVWEQVGGYDANIPLLGVEDWDLWMTMHENGVGFHFIDEVLFDYRVVPGSIRSNLSKRENADKVEHYLAIKHAPIYRKNFVEVIVELNYAKSRPLSFFLKYKFNGLYKILKNIKNSRKNYQ